MLSSYLYLSNNLFKAFLVGVNSDVAMKKSKKSIGVKLDPQINKKHGKGEGCGAAKNLEESVSTAPSTYNPLISQVLFWLLALNVSIKH